MRIHLGRISLLRAPGPDLRARPLFCMCLHLSVYLSVCLSDCLPICRSVYLSIDLFFFISHALSSSLFCFSPFFFFIFFFPLFFLQGHIQRREAPLGARPGAAAPPAPILIRLREMKEQIRTQKRNDEFGANSVSASVPSLLSLLIFLDCCLRPLAIA